MLEMKSDPPTSEDGLGEDPIGRNGSPPWSDHSRLFAIASRISKNIDYLFSATWNRVEACQRAIGSLKTKVDGINGRVTKQDDDIKLRVGDMARDISTALQVIGDRISAVEKDISEVKKGTTSAQSLVKYATTTVNDFRDEHRHLLTKSDNLLDKVERRIDHELDRFRKIVDDVQGKRILGYMTIDEYCVERGATGPMDESIRMKHEAEIAKVLRSSGGEPGIAKAPFGKMMVTFPRDLIERQMGVSKSNRS